MEIHNNGKRQFKHNILIDQATPTDFFKLIFAMQTFVLF